MTQQSLITISEASQLLGVSEATLRQWTDERKIKAFVTPGGHRRYSKLELKSFINSRQKTLGIKELANELEETVQLHREIAKEHILPTSWYSKLTKESQTDIAQLGKRILDLIIRYITEPSKQEEIIAMSRDEGHKFGETLAGLGLPLTDSVEAFLSHRAPIINAITQLLRKREALNRRVVEAMPSVTLIMDEVLLSLVSAHQQFYQNPVNTLEGDTIK